MLVVSRKTDERIRIGGDVWVTVTRIEADKVRLGIEAPPTVPILREELLTQEQRHERDGKSA